MLYPKHLKILEDVESHEEQIAIIQNYHYGKSNHRGINETLQKISSRYYWPNMQKAIQNFINKCEICKAVKYDRKPLKLKFNLTPTPTKPFEIVHIDVLKYQSHKFLTIIDAFSKYAQVYLLENMQAIEIMKKLLIFFSHHSVPSLIITDNGSEFDNGVVTEFFRLHKIDVHFCSPHHPASNGLIERFHSTFLEHLNLLNNRPEFSKDPISTKILYATIAYNNSIYSTTKLTPFNVLNLNNEQEIGDINLEYLNRLQTLEFVPEINQYLGIFPVPVPIKTSCSNVLAQHQIQGVFLFENQLNCQKYVNDQLLIFNDTTEGKPIILEDFRLPARNNAKIPKLTLRTLQVTSLTNNLPRLQMYPYEDSKNIWHLTGTAILYFVFLALAIWFMMQKIAFRRRNQTEEAPEPVELPRDAKF
ncbi:Pro-Pol polyprotein-like Protein [Tribolium castaneum]|uniref:RNA-directed DNA polymerase n=1 Tax=Tribolium castaneum TaxID=7070 RepID=A0A139W8T7_TRICA|nr:Pro-Pol polyprotein-like Protein [Tribolium castaneum]